MPGYAERQHRTSAGRKLRSGGIELFGPSLVDAMKSLGPQKEKGGQVAKLGLMQEPSDGSLGGHSGAAVHHEASTSVAKFSQSRRYHHARWTNMFQDISTGSIHTKTCQLHATAYLGTRDRRGKHSLRFVPNIGASRQGRDLPNVPVKRV
jgi:hypothetical protein